MDYIFNFFLILVCCYSLNGFPEKGLSVSMVNSKSYDYNKWEILRGWDVSTHLVGQYIRGLMFDDAKAVIKIQTPGIYYISFHVILENIEDSLTAAISINNKFDSFPIVSALRVNETSTVGASGFLKLTASDTISVAAYSTKSYTVSKNTALIIRYHDDALSVSGFLFSLPEYALNNKTTSLMLGPWAAPIYGQFSSSLSFQPGQYEYTVPINGSYMITLNLILTILQFEYDVQLSLYASNLLIFNIDIEEIPFSTATVNLNEIVHLNFGEVLRVILTTNGARLNLQDMSSWSVLLLMQQEDIVNGFRGTLENSLIIFDTNEYQIIGKWLPQNNTLDFSQLLSSSVENGNSFNTKSDGMFYATVDLSFSLFMNISQKGYFSLSFFQEPNGIFAEKRVIPKLQGITIDGLSVQTYRVSLAGVFELSRTTPLSVAIDGKNISKFIINKESSFAIIETSSLYPGFHGALDSSMHVSNNDRNKIKEWKSFNSDIGGLYDFTNGLSIGNDIYTVSEDGLYLAVANIVVSDVDDGCIYGFVKRLSTDSDSVSAKCCSLALKMAFNFGGFFLLKRGETLFVELQANIDEDWKVLLSGFTVAYMGMNPIYFQSGLNDVVVVDQGTITIDNWQNTADSLVTNGKFVAPYDGVYFTVANIIVKVDRYFESEKKAYISIDGQEVKGLYSKKKTYIGTSFILFLSGSFYATKNSIIAVNLQTGTQLNVLVESTWGIVLVSSSTEVSGALGVLNKDSYFSDQVGDWKNAGIWTFNDNQDFNGQYLQSITLSFDDSTYINVLEEGVYLISANIEVFCNVIRSLYKISVHLNDDLETGLTVWQSSTWKKETLHLCGALFLKKNDKIYLRVSFDNFLDTTILSGSGLSIVLLSNSEASSSFFAILKDDFDVGSIEKTLSKWYFPTLLATNNFDLNTGIVNISQSGFYMLSITLLFEKSNQTFVNGVTVALLVNANAKINFSLTFQETELHFHFSEIYFFNFEDTISLSVVNNYDTLKISESQSHFNISEEMLNAKIRKTVSSFSLSYLPEMKASRGWSMNIFAQEIVNAHETDFSLESWSDLKEQSGSSPEGDYFVKTSGNYLLESKINLYNINGSVEISFVNDKAKICTSALECIGNCRILLEMNCFAALILNDAVSIVVKSSDYPVRVDIGSLRVVNLITTSNVGFGKTLFSDLRLELTLDNWHSVGPWVSNKTNYYGLFDKNFQTFENKSIVLRQGTYQVVANLIVDFRRSNFNSNCSITLMSGVFVDNDLAVSMFQQTVLYAQHNVITINLVGNFKIRKWAQMEIKMKLSTNANITLLQSSSWGAVLIANSSFSRSSDKGPLMLTKFSPANYSTWLVGLTKEWTCEAAGDGDLTYIWYKNNEIIDVQQSTIGILKIAGYINDSGSYNCVVELDNINASSNSLNVNIYDINECALNIYNCSKNATCYNTPGSFICLCNHGFFDDGLECIDENECTTGNFLCGINAQCINTFGSYICMCNKGFEGDGRDCRNINECLDSLRNNQSICVPNAECEDTIGSYTCKCPVGFEGNGTVSCNDKNECDDSNFCYLNSVCINTIGSAKCKCNPGYSAYGKQCIDTDECMGPNPCINGNCSNTVGSFTCLCPTGYLLNGFTCEANSPQSGKQTTCLKDSQSYACLCGDNAKRENNILCNGLFLALIILSVIAVIVVIFVVKYMKSRKLKKIGPVKVHKEKYIEMENEFEI